jgi:hypothetical protein
MLAELPVELLGGIVSYGSTKDLFNLRLTSRLLHNSLSEAFGRRFFQQRTHHYTTRSLQLLLELSQSVSIQNALKELTIVAVEPLYRDDDALQQLLRPQVIGKRAESLWHQNRHHRSTSKPPAFPDVARFSSDWLALQESINEQCASMLKEALTNLARAQQTPPMLLLRYEPRKWDGYRYKFDTPAALAQFVGADDSYLGVNEPVKTLTPILSTASEIGYPIAGIELGRGSHNHHWGVSTFEPLIQVSPSALANLRRMDIALTITAADLDDDRDEGLRYMLSLSASLAELNIAFCHKDRVLLTSEYMTTWAHCVSDAPLTSLSITNGHMSADGLGKLLEPHSGTLRSLQLYYVSFGDDDEPLAMLERLSGFPMLDTLDLVGLARRGTDVAIDMETLGSVFSARGRAAVRELWREFMVGYCVE